MNKKGLTNDDIFEWIKITIVFIVGYILIKALLSVSGTDFECVECVCECICNYSENIIRLGGK